eukprot:766113-Hanusia_phi.AAC.3
MQERRGESGGKRKEEKRRERRRGGRERMRRWQVLIVPEASGWQEEGEGESAMARSDASHVETAALSSLPPAADDVISNEVESMKTQQQRQGQDC